MSAIGLRTARIPRRSSPADGGRARAPRRRRDRSRSWRCRRRHRRPPRRPPRAAAAGRSRAALSRRSGSTSATARRSRSPNASTAVTQIPRPGGRCGQRHGSTPPRCSTCGRGVRHRPARAGGARWPGVMTWRWSSTVPRGLPNPEPLHQCACVPPGEAVRQQRRALCRLPRLREAGEGPDRAHSGQAPAPARSRTARSRRHAARQHHLVGVRRGDPELPSGPDRALEIGRERDRRERRIVADHASRRRRGTPSPWSPRRPGTRPRRPARRPPATPSDRCCRRARPRSPRCDRHRRRECAAQFQQHQRGLRRCSRRRTALSTSPAPRRRPCRRCRGPRG